jgi:hypothetical protein
LDKFFNLSIDELVQNDFSVPKEIKLEDKTANEKVLLIYQLDGKFKKVFYRIIDRLLTKNKFQSFFEQNIQIAK